MKLVKFLSLLSFLYFTSCSTDENNKETDNDLKSYSTEYMDYSNLMVGSIGSVKLEYDSQRRIIKKNGGFSPLPASLGNETYIFSPDVTEAIVYTNNEIKITRNIPNINLFFERKIVVDNQNRIIKKIIYKQDPELNDSIFYTYNNLNQIDETIKLYGKPNYLSKFSQKAKYYYNPQQNLDSIVTVNFEEGQQVTGVRIVEKFSNYDNAANPLKKLILFDETYYRAISKNNYSKYEKLSYSNDKLTEKTNKNYQYRYDASGNIMYDFE
ncbi:hypothetical protein [Flavobacterium hibisci]|uniref:hypothetical protein n=1 Tax=Flavobacterium hibisci TaxID=1914462 RepID=UPI001CBD8D9C|nr:hypothetical protein [Flavobacterium hibisci]MBZ4042758.1 hypothetical protein [Flavobacterium hibisci]